MPKRNQTQPFDVLTTITVALGAFLLFLIQPLAARALLPGFGGVPAVWAAALACYQVLLFVGYLGAHLLRTRGSGREQAVIVTVLVGAAMLSLPALPRPSDGGGVWAIITSLMLAVGPAFVVLALGGPLVQSWSRSSGRGVYSLYAVSNAASLVALLGYPLFFERLLGVTDLSRLWGVLFTVQGALLILLAWRRRHDSGSKVEKQQSIPHPDSLRLVGLAAVGVIMLNAVTTWLGQDVASVPLLWTGPLALYLLTWVASFSGRIRIGYWTASILVFGAAGIMIVMMSPNLVHDLLTRLVLGMIALGAGCLAVHGVLYRMRPDATRLTGFYLRLAGGGAIGGVISGFMAPSLGAGWMEITLGFGFAMLLVSDEKNTTGKLRRVPRFAMMVVPTLLWSGLLISSMSTRDGEVFDHRDFHGLIRVIEEKPDVENEHRLIMMHGATRHGMQYLTPSRRSAPTAYFGPTTGGGLAFQVRRSVINNDRGLRVGVVGLGIGTLAAYGHAGDRMSFYELSPAVAALAQGDHADELPLGGFTFLSDSAAEIDVVLGDARVSMAREINKDPTGQRYDLLILDAFAGDVVPIHLLTTEAFGLYERHLESDGMIAVHVSSNWLDLRPVLYAWAEKNDWRALTIANQAGQAHDGRMFSTWVLLFRGLETLSALRDHCTPLMQSGVIQVENRDDVNYGLSQPWTDDRSDLISVLRAQVSAR
jgi:hypothetical protein